MPRRILVASAAEPDAFAASLVVSSSSAAAAVAMAGDKPQPLTLPHS